MSSKIPKWIKDLPDDDMRKDTLVQLSKVSKGGLCKPREIVFTIMDVATKADVNGIKDYAQKEQWQVVVEQDAQYEYLYWIDLKKDGYVIEEEQFLIDYNFFSRLAKLYDATLEGWRASI